jgi:hypothetical protein
MHADRLLTYGIAFVETKQATFSVGIRFPAVWIRAISRHCETSGALFRLIESKLLLPVGPPPFSWWRLEASSFSFPVRLFPCPYRICYLVLRVSDDLLRVLL